MIPNRENKNNVLITETDITNILNKYEVDVPINNIDIYQKAFIHRSYLKVINNESKDDYFEQSNERYELLGDCILNCIVGTYLFTRFENKNEGELTKLKIKIIKSKTLGMLSKKMDLNKYIIISSHVEDENGRLNIRILEDLFECFIGAIFLDNHKNKIDSDWFNSIKKITDMEKLLIEHELKIKKNDLSEILLYIELNKKYREIVNMLISDKSNGFYICQKFIINVIETELDLLSINLINDNYKDQLQQYFLKNYKNLFPRWEVLNIEGPTNNRIHTVCVKDEKGEIIGLGKSKKKIDAEQIASKQALVSLGLILDNEESSYCFE